MLLALPWSAKAVIVEHFISRYSRQEGAFEDSGPESRSHVVVFLLAKKQCPLEWSDFRGIGLLDVVAKWYMGSLVALASSTPVPRRFRHVRFYGTGLVGCPEVTAALHITLAKSWEWN